MIFEHPDELFAKARLQYRVKGLLFYKWVTVNQDYQYLICPEIALPTPEQIVSGLKSKGRPRKLIKAYSRDFVQNAKQLSTKKW